MTIAAAAFDHIRQLVRLRSAIVLDDGKEYLVEARLTPIAKARGFGSIEELSARLTTQPELVDEVVQAMTTNETSFFRDVHPFEALRQHVLPDLLQRRAKLRQLRIWCGACSSGQEPYTISILLREHFPELSAWDVTILATDLSTAMLEKARSGCYRQLEVNRGLSGQHLVKYFERTGLDWRLRADVRSSVQFEPMNLIAPWRSTPSFDIVFLRNVLIYFDVDVKRSILGKVNQRLARDGYLFLGGAESTMNLDSSFERAPYERAGCYRLTSVGGSACIAKS
jgi:chemotaxis protein methyltransferase CheR